LNTLPREHEAAGLDLASQIEPLDEDGNRDANGAIAVISIGVSNTFREFQDFITIVEGKTAPSIVLVNGAQAGEGVSKWADPHGAPWAGADAALRVAGVSSAQVQAAWVKVPERILTWDELEPFPIDARTYRDELVEVLRIARDRYPNLRIAYLSSRIYGGYSTSAAPSPEPLTYENGFGVKWTIEDQINRVPGLNHDPSLGPVELPWIAWGPYLWADGTTPRADGLTWDCSDLLRDGTHPTESGIRKVAVLLAQHFLSAPTSVPWFTSTGGPVEIGELPPFAPQQLGDRGSSSDTERDRSDRQQGSRTPTTTSTSTNALDAGPVAPDTQDRLDSAAEAARADTSTPVGLALVVSSFALALILGALALLMLRRKDTG
ncbi:MAG: hypothetical protein ABFR53_10555, partial [Actinomycetota bacterium]